MDLRGGRAGDDSLEGLGEVVAEVVRLGCSRFVVGIEEASLGVFDGVDVVDVSWSMAPIGPAVSRAGLSSMVGGFAVHPQRGDVSRRREREERELRGREEKMIENLWSCLGIHDDARLGQQASGTGPRQFGPVAPWTRGYVSRGNGEESRLW